MGNDKIKIYWDSCCFLAVLNDEAEFGDVCCQIVNESKLGEIDLFFSPLTMAETVRPKGSASPLSRENRDKVLGFFENDYITFINFSREIARSSLELCWDYELHARDSMHLAAALSASCNFLETTDAKLLSMNGKISDIEIRKPKGKGQGNLL